MTINKITFTTLVASFFIFQISHTVSADPFTINQFVGTWYTVAIISPELDESSDVACTQVKITKIDDASQRFRIDVGTERDAVPKHYVGYGNIINSQVHVSYLNSSNIVSVYTVTSFDRGNTLILHDSTGVQTSDLMSRSLFVSAKAHRQIQNHATILGQYLLYPLHRGCTYQIL